MPVQSLKTLPVSPVGRTATLNRALETSMPTQMSLISTPDIAEICASYSCLPDTGSKHPGIPSSSAAKCVAIPSSVRFLRPALTAICHTFPTYKHTPIICFRHGLVQQFGQLLFCARRQRTGWAHYRKSWSSPSHYSSFDHNSV